MQTCVQSFECFMWPFHPHHRTFRKFCALVQHPRPGRGGGLRNPWLCTKESGIWPSFHVSGMLSQACCLRHGVSGMVTLAWYLRHRVSRMVSQACCLNHFVLGMLLRHSDSGMLSLACWHRHGVAGMVSLASGRPFMLSGMLSVAALGPGDVCVSVAMFVLYLWVIEPSANIDPIPVLAGIKKRQGIKDLQNAVYKWYTIMQKKGIFKIYQL